MDISQQGADNDNTGLCNRSFYNHGNCNSESWNTGSHNNGYENSGSWNNGSCNSGDPNNGHINADSCNNGDYNSGGGNIGNGNSGNGNAGNWNSGDFNFTNGSNGCFNTVEPKIHLFNQPSDWTLSQWRNSKVHTILRRLITPSVLWLPSSKMTEREKQEHPEHAVTKGCLKPLDREKQTAQMVENWKALSDEEKHEILSIPNFDKEIFQQITGIDIDRD